MKILVRCAVFALLACTVPLPYFTVPKGFGVVPLLAMVLSAVIPKLTATVGVAGITLGLLQALVWVVLLWAVAGSAEKRYASLSDERRVTTAVVTVLALVALAFLPIYTTPGDDTPWISAVAMQVWMLLLALLAGGATM